MKRNLIAVSIAAAFALPFAAHAGGDKASQGASSAGGSGAEKMFQALDKDKDGSITKAEAKGTPHDKDFATLDKNSDGKLSREEHAAAPEHAGKAKSGSAGATSSGAAAPSAGGASGGAAGSTGSKPKY